MTPHYQKQQFSLTKHGLGNGKGDGRTASHPPARGEVGQVCPQHFYNHLVVQSQIELLMIDELQGGNKHREIKTNNVKRQNMKNIWHVAYI